MLVFVLVVSVIVGGVHFYLWARLVRDTQPPQAWKVAATAACVALGLALPISFVLMRRLPSTGASVLAWPVYIWMGVMFLLFLLLAASDIVRLALRLLQGAPADPERRLLLARALGGGVGAGAALLGGWALQRALAAVEVANVTVHLPQLPAGTKPTTIVQLTDLHVGPTIGRRFIEHVVRKTNELAPDIIAITGDLVDGSVERLRDAVAPLGDLRAKQGVFFVTGNHEYFSGVGPWLAELQRLGIRVLRNERVPLASFDLAGVDDWTASRFTPDHGHDLNKALAGRDPARPVVLLAHQPKAILEASAQGVALQLSGHTHGGQIWPFTFLVKLAQPYVAGLHRHGDTHIYVSPGTGYWGPPMRLGTRAEITHITLLPA